MLFATVEKLTNPSSRLAPELLSVKKYEFVYFFIGKIGQIRQNISSQLQTTQDLILPATKRKELILMSEFS